MARLIFLGTGAALPTAHRANTTLAISGAEPGRWLLIDCGGDVYRALVRADIPVDGVTDLFITHAHIDHIGALPSLIESFRIGGRRAPLRIWGIPEVMEVVDHLLALYRYELTLDQWPFAITFHRTLPGSDLKLAGLDVRIEAMDHALPSVGLRLALPGGPVCYSCDTQPTPKLAELARGVVLLITECTFLHRDQAAARHSRHLTAREAGEQAAAADARALALVHLGVGDHWSEESARAEAASAFSGPILIPDDGQAIEV
ncbi:MAG TPA: MBL fold metallo-hydrolase [Ktedonobacterales bacterium]|nr:MBL fold metallo-hydrolase [Ktedonobacterales bacterium]